ncbi:cytidylate kinase [Thiohalobacter sp. COW1]|uniref:Cytidylate kinase n=1 Tax=Thiohalobacter thiocyanaticus TaxID=585455 RepID=A0A1Z4VSE5_9GAMM|nr:MULTISPECIES: (d)CMP kinase [Thiohalobacter]BAZ94557.1 cytidylate kinase [Thiohalobacter thiocyanaticus]BCO30360.1 cytidylate kinase [Thiohalobacter sp. COW1]
MSDQAPVVAVDGPSGSGKGTVSRALATRLGWHFLDSGALYRLVAHAALDRGVALDDEAGLADLARHLEVRFDTDSDRIWLGDEEVSLAIRSEAAGDAASRVAALPGVREALLQLQRDFRAAPGLVADGRDMGSVVFPAAEVKIFLTASAGERARRRYNQLKEKGIEADIAELVAAIEARDKRDMERPVAPLKPAEDAVELDTSGLDIEGSIAAALGIVRGRLGA